MRRRERHLELMQQHHRNQLGLEKRKPRPQAALPAHRERNKHKRVPLPLPLLREMLRVKPIGPLPVRGVTVQRPHVDQHRRATFDVQRRTLGGVESDVFGDQPADDGHGGREAHGLLQAHAEVLELAEVGQGVVVVAVGGRRRPEEGVDFIVESLLDLREFSHVRQKEGQRVVRGLVSGSNDREHLVNDFLM